MPHDRLSEGAAPNSEAWVSRTVLENAEVVPVPDEQAIERGIEAGWRASSSESMTLREITNIARAVLAAALEQPESPDQGSTASIGDPHGEVSTEAQ